MTYNSKMRDKVFADGFPVEYIISNPMLSTSLECEFREFLRFALGQRVPWRLRFLRGNLNFCFLHFRDESAGEIARDEILASLFKGEDFKCQRTSKDGIAVAAEQKKQRQRHF